MTILANGNIGINQVNPAAKLDVNGTSLFSDQIKLDVTPSSNAIAQNYSDFAILLYQSTTPARSSGFYQRLADLHISTQSRIRFLTEGTIRLDIGNGQTNLYHDLNFQPNCDLKLSSTSNIMVNSTSISPTVLSYLDGVTSNIHTQLNASSSIKLRYNGVNYDSIGRVKFVDTDQYLDANDGFVYSIEYVGHKSSFYQNSGQFIGTEKLWQFLIKI